MNSNASANALSQPPAVGFRRRLRIFLLWIVCGSLTLAVLLPLALAVRKAQRAAIASASKSPLNQLQLALLNYHDFHGRFPPAFMADETARPLHSWRVLILPFIEQQALYDAYDFTEPWNGPNNSKLLDQMPAIFHSPSETASKRFTNIVAVTGPSTAFPGSSTTSLVDFVDGAENTILLTEITHSNVPWLQPRDIDARQSSLLSTGADGLSISAIHWRRPYVVFADHIRAYAVRSDIPREALKALTTIAGREPVTRSKLINQGYLE